jgi:hypothetical protein
MWKKREQSMRYPRTSPIPHWFHKEYADITALSGVHCLNFHRMKSGHTRRKRRMGMAISITIYKLIDSVATG